MEKMRVVLKRLIEESGRTAYDIQRETGIRTSSTYRFLRGEYSELGNSTIKKLANFFNVTEAQLRGDEPIGGVKPPPEPQELKNLLTQTDYKHLTNMKKLGEEARGILHRLSELLAEESQASTNNTADRRVTVEKSNNQLRAGEVHYQAPPSKSRVRESYGSRRKA